MCRNCLILFLVCFSFQASSQEVSPADGSVLTQTSILFEVPEVISAKTYTFEVTSKDGVVSKFIEPNQSLIIEGLDFGQKYSWQVVASNQEKEVLKTFENSFEIATSHWVDPTENRFRVIETSEKSALDGVLFLDNSRVAITPQGTPVWFMPERETMKDKRLRDFKLTSHGTLTYLGGTNCEEITLSGKTVWSAPSDGSISGDSLDYFHHEFKRCGNGNYMALGKTYIESDLIINGKLITSIPLSIIIEYSPDGEILWTWSSNEYITQEDIQKVGQKVALGNTFGHMNSFYLDEPSGIIYAGFRDLNCILAIDKTSGSVLQSYGDKIPSDTTNQAVGFFSKQHAPIKLPNDQILLFNNNDRNKPSSVQIISEVSKTNPVSKIEWEFVCDFDTLMPAASARMGNAVPIENGNLLVNMGSVARIFEVTSNKEVLWQCFPEKWNASSQNWSPEPNYRVFQASSLYPYHHTISLHKEQNDYSIRIDNEGSENDRYEIKLGKKEKHLIKAQGIQVEIKTKEAGVFDLKKYYPKSKLPKSIFIQVQPVNNPDRILTHEYQLN